MVQDAVALAFRRAAISPISSLPTLPIASKKADVYEQRAMALAVAAESARNRWRLPAGLSEAELLHGYGAPASACAIGLGAGLSISLALMPRAVAAVVWGGFPS